MNLAPVETDRNKNATRNVGALVVGGDHPGLGVVRSLGRRGIPVYVLDNEQSVSRFSRYASRYIFVKNLRNERSVVDAVFEVGRRYGLENWVLFPTRDETVAAFSRYRDELSQFFRVTTPPWDTVRWVWDKKNTYELAEELGIPCPKTFNPRTLDDLPALYPHLPLAVKPAVKENFFYATGAKAWRANTVEELHRLFETARSHIRPEEILLQEIIPGDGRYQMSYCAFYRDGQAKSTLLARRARQHPHEFGRAATYVETIDLPAIEELSERFLRKIDFYGLVEVEFKQDPRDGQYKLLDVNARTWGFHRLGEAAGVDFPYLLYADQVGLPVTASRGRAGVGWMRLVTDVPTALSGMLRGRIGLKSYIQSLGRTRVESVFCKEDPMPSLMEIALLPYSIMKRYYSKAHPRNCPIGKEGKLDRSNTQREMRKQGVTRNGGILPNGKLGLKARELVRVKSKEEILRTLDKNGRLEELPFMPQMLSYCGKEFEVRKRAHKLCDTAFSTGARSMVNAVVLDLRCDGAAYGGCEMQCVMFWKEAWLERVNGPKQEAPAVAGGCTEEDLWRGSRVVGTDSGEPVYVCQATQMLKATQSLSPWSMKQYVEDYKSGNAKLKQILSGVMFQVYEMLVDSGLGFGTALKWGYNAFQKVRGGTPYPALRGHLAKNTKTPSMRLKLEVGELVRIKDHESILCTVDEQLRNRGMSFHPEMVPYCGKTFRVQQVVRKIINERTGRLMELKNECVVLEGAACVGRYTKPLFCPRACYPYWREIWLERVNEPTAHGAPLTVQAAGPVKQK